MPFFFVVVPAFGATLRSNPIWPTAVPSPARQRDLMSAYEQPKTRPLVSSNGLIPELVQLNERAYNVVVTKQL